MADVDSLSNEGSVEALSRVAREWFENRGLEAYIVVDGAKSLAGDALDKAPAWARGTATADEESGEFCRRMLAALSGGTDAEVKAWTDRAVESVSAARAQVIDPVTLAIGGVILIGAILAARVKRIGSVEFYEGVPEELAGVIKAGSGVASLVD